VITPHKQTLAALDSIFARRPAPPDLDGVGDKLAAAVQVQGHADGNLYAAERPRIDITDMLQATLDGMAGTREDDDLQAVVEVSAIALEVEGGRVFVVGQDVDVERYGDE
jgi:hypothetical protein